jgi:hypothetical protein
MNFPGLLEKLWDLLSLAVLVLSRRSYYIGKNQKDHPTVCHIKTSCSSSRVDEVTKDP